MSRLRIRLRMGLAVLISLALLTAGASGAIALQVSVINTDGAGVSSRYAPLIAATNGYGAPAGASVNTVCWTYGDPVGPNANRLWWLISYSGRQFYVADRYLSTPYVSGSTPSEPRCGSSTSAPASLPSVWVGSPINGTWDLPASQGGDGPTLHHWLGNAVDKGDWAVDLIAGAGSAVYLYAAPQDGASAITAKVDQVGESCGSGRQGGSFATIGFYSGSARIGSATYAHLRVAVTQGQTIGRWGSLIGYVGSGYPPDQYCWTGPHVHFQLYSQREYSCFNKGYSLGYPLSRSNFLGFTRGASGPRQACA